MIIQKRVGSKFMDNMREFIFVAGPSRNFGGKKILYCLGFFKKAVSRIAEAAKAAAI